jgi:hypothetical protein
MLVTEQSFVGESRWRCGKPPPRMPTIHSRATNVHPCGTRVHPPFRRRPTSTLTAFPVSYPLSVESVLGRRSRRRAATAKVGQAQRWQRSRSGAGTVFVPTPTARFSCASGRYRHLGPYWPASSPRGYRRSSVAATWTNTPVSSAISRPRPRGNGPPFILPRMKPSSGSASITSNGAFA